MVRTLDNLVSAVALNDYEKESEITTELEEWINEGYYEIADYDLSSFEAKHTITTAPGDYEYDMPSDCRKVIGVYDENGAIEWSDIKRYTRQNPDPSSDGEDSPASCAIYGGSIYFYPTPDDAYDITILYYKLPDRLSDSNPNHILPSNKESMLIDYATAKYNEREKDYEKATNLFNKFYAKIENWMDKDYEKVEDSSSMVELERQYKRRMRGY